MQEGCNRGINLPRQKFAQCFQLHPYPEEKPMRNAG